MPSGNDETLATGGSGPVPGPPIGRPTECPEDPAGEVLAGWTAAVAAVFAAYRFLPAAAAPFAAAGVWIAVPIAFHLARGRPLEAEGIAWKSPRRTLRLTALYAAVFLPLFAIAYLVYHGWVVPRAPGVAVAPPPWRWPGIDVFAVSLVAHLFYAALPEECFFRGFVQPLLGRRYPPAPRRVLFVPLSPPIILASALFALTHIAFEATPFSLAAAGRLLTFFPGLLFGALREETGDVVAPALFHALCNATLYALQRGYVA